MKRVAVIGLGLMGGSLGLALKARGLADRVAGYARREETRRKALEMGAVDEAHDAPEKAVAGADIAVFCVPILAIPDLVMTCRRSLHHRCIVTDVGSTKAELDARVEPLLQGTPGAYIGCHPIAGSEQQGLESARADLYDGAVVVVTPGKERAAWLLDEITAFWQGLGAVVRVMKPAEHDRIMARTSHLPHLVAALLARTVGRRGEGAAGLGEYCGPGFRDATRIAEGPAAVWHDIVQSNRHSIEKELEAFRGELNGLLEVLAGNRSEELVRFLDDARSTRIALAGGKPGGGKQGRI